MVRSQLTLQESGVGELERVEQVVSILFNFSISILPHPNGESS